MGRQLLMENCPGLGFVPIRCNSLIAHAGGRVQISACSCHAPPHEYEVKEGLGTVTSTLKTFIRNRAGAASSAAEKPGDSSDGGKGASEKKE